MPRPHAKRRIIALSAAAIFTTGLFAAPAAFAEPQVTPESVEEIFHRAEAANEAVQELVEQQETLAARIANLEAEIEAVEADYEEQRDELGASIVQQQLDSPLGATVSLLNSKDADEFLNGLSTIDAINTSRAEALDAFSKIGLDLKNRQTQLAAHQADLEQARAEAEENEAELQSSYEEAQAELERLTAAQQAELQQSNVTAASVPADPSAPEVVNESANPGPASGGAGQAIAFAQGKIGTPYVYGGTGPNGYDCSGLVQAAFASAGISLPRTVGPQINAGRRIAFSDLQPGDLVAYASMSHIGIYIGNGRVIHAPRPGKTVEYTGLSGFSVAARVG